MFQQHTVLFPMAPNLPQTKHIVTKALFIHSVLINALFPNTLTVDPVLILQKSNQGQEHTIRLEIIKRVAQLCSSGKCTWNTHSWDSAGLTGPVSSGRQLLDPLNPTRLKITRRTPLVIRLEITRHSCVNREARIPARWFEHVFLFIYLFIFTKHI